jgi:hypothetical protein
MLQTDTSMTTDRAPISPETMAITAVSMPSSHTVGYELQAQNVPFPAMRAFVFKSDR